jgi:hypothetical protein
MQQVTLLSRREAAARARISVRTLDANIAAGHGPCPTRIGRRLLVSETDLNAWLTGLRQPSSECTPSASSTNPARGGAKALASAPVYTASPVSNPVRRRLDRSQARPARF